MTVKAYDFLILTSRLLFKCSFKCMINDFTNNLLKCSTKGSPKQSVQVYYSNQSVLLSVGIQTTFNRELFTAIE